MGESKREGRFGRRKLAFREGAVHVLLLFMLGLFVYFYLIKSDRTAVPTFAQGDGAETLPTMPRRRWGRCPNPSP